MEPIKDIRGNIIEPGDVLITPIGGCHLAETKLIRYTNRGCYISRAIPTYITSNLSGFPIKVPDFASYTDVNLQTKELYRHEKKIKENAFLIIKKHNC